MAAKLRETSLRLPGICSVDWRAECILGSSLRSEIMAPAIQLRLGLSGSLRRSGNHNSGDFNATASQFCFELDDTTFSLFRAEMHSALQTLDRV